MMKATPIKADAVEYVGKDLEAMDHAVNYHEWVYSLMKPFLGTRIVEVGAGTGSFSELLWAGRPERLTLIEPSAMFEGLRERFGAQRENDRIRLVRAVFSHVVAEIAADEPDSVIYNNVLEHIEDDAAELRLVWNALRPGGRVLIFVPAGRFLFSEFDRHIGHFRRYGRNEIERKIKDAGFRVIETRAVDAAGIVPWLFKYRLLRSITMEPGAVRLYDRLAVPIVRRMEAVIKPPFGKNLLVVGKKR